MTSITSPIGIYGILDCGTMAPERLPAAALAMANGGIRMFQVRGKNLPGGRLAVLVRAIRVVLPSDAVLLVNDRCDVARVTDADGVHVGDEDLPVRDARSILEDGGRGPRLVGFSTHSPIEAAGAEADSGRIDVHAPDYIGVGPIFASGTKVTGRTPLGLDGLRLACAATNLPVVAIGGIKVVDVPAIRAAGASGVAMIADLLIDGCIETRARQAVEAFACTPREARGG